MTNSTPAWLYCSLDGGGLRRDHFLRSEMSKGCVDYAVNSEYSLRSERNLEELKPVYIFAIDISILSIRTKLAQTSIHVISQLLIQLVKKEENLHMEIGIVTFSSSAVYFYSSPSEDDSKVSMFVCGGDDPAVPFPTNQWILPLHSAYERLSSLLRRLESLLFLWEEEDRREEEGRFGHIRSNYNGVYGIPSPPDVTRLLNCLLTALESTGGRVFILTTALPLTIDLLTVERPVNGHEFLSHSPVNIALESPCSKVEKDEMEKFAGLCEKSLKHAVTVTILLNDIISELMNAGNIHFFYFFLLLVTFNFALVAAKPSLM